MIVAAGLSPAWQEIFVFDEFHRSQVNRAREVHRSAGGKVFNAALAARSLGGAVRVVSIVGGESGARVRRDLERQGVGGAYVASDSPTRSCTTIVDRSRPGASELVENAPAVCEAELQEFRRRFREEAADADIVLLSGSIPEGADRALFRDLLRDAPRARAVVDAAGDVLRHSLECSPFLVKPNRLELEIVVGRKLETSRDILDASAELHAAGAKWVVVSDGARDTIVSCEAGDCWSLRPVRVAEVNAIGCGDSMAGGIAQALDAGLEVVDAVRVGLAAAASNLEQVWMGRLDRERVDRYSRGIEARPLER